MKKQINFLRGWPNPSLLPTAQIQAAAAVALSDPSVSTPGLLYGPDPGYQPLRKNIAKWLEDFYAPSLRKWRGGEGAANVEGSWGADPERICVTGGASQNLACVLQVYTDPLYTRVWMVAPCYFLASRIFDDSSLKTTAVGEGKEGIDLVALERGLTEAGKEQGEATKLKKPKPWSKVYRHIIYCVPTFSNPSGKSMSLSHRIELVKLARKHDALIVTDDVYDFLQWPTSSTSPSSLTHALLPRLVDVDRTLEPVPGQESFGNAVNNGSFSKIAGPGVRTGWAEATRKFTYGLSQCGSSRSGGAPSQLTATIINELLNSSSLQTHIETVLKPAYQKRYNIMINAIQQELIPLGVRISKETLEGKDGVFGGYFIWLELPSGVDAEVVASRAKNEEELIVAPGKIFEVQDDDNIKFPHGIRLCFSWEEEEDLKEGVVRLALVVRAVIGDKIGDGEKVSKQDLDDFK